MTFYGRFSDNKTEYPTIDRRVGYGDGCMLTFSDFLKALYKPQGKSGIIFGYTTREKVPAFFIEFGLKKDHDECLNLQPASYGNWVSGARKLRPTTWKKMANSFALENLRKELEDRLVDESIPAVLCCFEVDVPEEVAVTPLLKKTLAQAITDQFEAIVKQNGAARILIAERFVNFEWHSKDQSASVPPLVDDAAPSDQFDRYLTEASKEYSVLKLPGADIGRMEDCYVLSNVGESPVVFPNRGRANYISEVSLGGFRHFDKKRETPYVVLVGACGYGKTVMLQHLFLEAAEKYHESGLLPIFVRLYNFSSRTPDLVPYIVGCMNDFDPMISEDTVKCLLLKGNVQVLFDGFDEMDQEEIGHFQELISRFRHHYPNNQIVITSRDCSEIWGLSDFRRLYIHPLTPQQVDSLIEKMQASEKTNAANVLAVKSARSQNDCFLRDGFIASNPMLLTIMLFHYSEWNIPKYGPKRFYKKIYSALTKDHDAEKQGYSRVFRSVSNEDEFTEAFREFCAYSYKDGLTSFDDTHFEKYFRQIKCKNTFKNPHAFTKSTFLFDACAKACMMYEKHPVVYYIDEGFQNYFAAEYYELVDPEEVKELGKTLLKDDKKRSVDALSMMYSESRVKVETCLILPYLESLFRGKRNLAAFLNYLKSGFGEIEFTVIDQNAVSAALKKTGAKQFNSVLEDNVIRNAIMHLIHLILRLPTEFTLDKEMPKIHQTAETTHFLTGSLVDSSKTEEESGESVIRCIRHNVILQSNVFFMEGQYDPFETIRDDEGNPVYFGYVYKVDPVKLVKNEENLRFFEAMAEEDKVYDMFNRVKQYYEKLVEAQQENQFL